MGGREATVSSAENCTFHHHGRDVLQLLDLKSGPKICKWGTDADTDA
jgi:hypothetical protein